MKIAEVIKYEGDNSTFVWKHPRNSDKGITEELKKLQIRQNEIYTELTKAR